MSIVEKTRPVACAEKTKTKKTTMYQKNNPETIQKMFGSIAASYDKTNEILSFGLHKKWNRTLVKTIIKEQQVDDLLDLCGGTGEITFAFLQHCKKTPANLYLLDFCEEMLQRAQCKAKRLPLNIQKNLSYIKADAQNIPLLDASVDAATVAYGIRNVQDPLKCIQEVYRVLRPGGSFGILELTRPTNPILNFGHRAYLNCFMPIAGWCVTANRDAYQYLCNSIQSFIEPDKLEKMLADSKFTEIKRIPLSGGIATILFAKKPA
jgi:demethylmenaquinone methyltransferase/2-methoxy-6-polyprenyl-1,4-benzoquinol methylase